jgi:Holliday junction resolvase RusA-like endonuclease
LTQKLSKLILDRQSDFVGTKVKSEDYCSFTIDCLPIPWKAPYKGSKGCFSPRYKEMIIVKDLIRDAYQKAGGKYLLGYVCIDMQFHFPMPKCVSKKRRAMMLSHQIRPVAGGDCTNCYKFFEDCMQGICIENDKFNVRVSASKWYAEKPYVDITIYRP